jgi:lipoprotein-anchoring transpeptidase ErfK/SrfK
VIAEALTAGRRTVELPVTITEPDRTADAYEHVLLVRQDERRLYHYADGEIAADWPVAIGGGGSPTPTGLFRVGAKRHSPSWHNPDPDGWGEDMPEYIGPGPDNPLGLRALNWNHHGSDTLIRFHGTANVQSIGERASQGCVRLTNDDVVELFDRVPSGTPIVSVRG